VRQCQTETQWRIEGQRLKARLRGAEGGGGGGWGETRGVRQRGEEERRGGEERRRGGEEVPVG